MEFKASSELPAEVPFEASSFQFPIFEYKSTIFLSSDCTSMQKFWIAIVIDSDFNFRQYYFI